MLILKVQLRTIFPPQSIFVGALSTIITLIVTACVMTIPHFGACPKSSNVSNSYNIFSLFVILFINFLTKVSMYE